MTPEKRPLRIGFLSTLFHTSILIKGMKWLEDLGIEPTWTLFGTGPAIVDAFSKGKLDIGYIGLSPTAIGIGKGIEIKCVAGGHVEGTVIVAKRNYKPMEYFSNDLGRTLAQFRGKKVGVPRRGSLHDVFLRHYLSQLGLSNDIEIINYDWADFIPEAMSVGEIEAAIGTPPLAIVLSRLLGTEIIVPPKWIWPNNPSYGIVTSKKMLKESSDLLETFLETHKKADCSLIRENPQKAAASVSKTVELVDENFVLATYKVSPKYCASLSREYVDSTVSLLDVLKNLGYLASTLEENDIFDHDLIGKIHPEKPHYTF